MINEAPCRAPVRPERIDGETGHADDQDDAPEQAHPDDTGLLTSFIANAGQEERNPQERPEGTPENHRRPGEHEPAEAHPTPEPRPARIRYGSRVPVEPENQLVCSAGLDSGLEKPCEKTTLENFGQVPDDSDDAVDSDGNERSTAPVTESADVGSSSTTGDAEVYTNRRVDKGQLSYIDDLMGRAGRAAGGEVPSPIAMRALFVHVLFCLAAYRHRYQDKGVPVPHYAILALPDAVFKTERVWWPLEAAGLISVRPFKDGVCRCFHVPMDIVVGFLDTRSTGKTRYNAVTRKKTTATYKTSLTYDDGQHSWKDASRLIYDTLRYWKHARVLANEPAMEAHLNELRAEAESARDERKAKGKALAEIKRSVRENAPYGPLTPEDYTPIRKPKEEYRIARRAEESAWACWVQDKHCWDVACDQKMQPAEGFPPGIVEYTPAYKVQMVSGRLGFISGGPQNLSQRGKAAHYSGIPSLTNYDIEGSQTCKLIEEFEDANLAGAGLDISVLTEYDGKEVLTETHGVAPEIFKRSEHASKFGAGFPHHTFEQAWKLAKGDAYDKVDEYGWGKGPSQYRTWDERVVAELKTMASVAYEVANDPDIPAFGDPEVVYALLRDIYGPMVREAKKWRRWLVTEHWASNSKAGGNGRFVEGPCGFAFNLYDHDEKDREKKYATNRLQGGEACYIHHLTLLGAKYGYEVLGNEHDGLVVLGQIPEAAVTEARHLSGFRTASIEPKRFSKHSPVGLPTTIDSETALAPCEDQPRVAASVKPTEHAATPATNDTRNAEHEETRDEPRRRDMPPRPPSRRRPRNPLPGTRRPDTNADWFGDGTWTDPLDDEDEYLTVNPPKPPEPPAWKRSSRPLPGR